MPAARIAHSAIPVARREIAVFIAAPLVRVYSPAACGSLSGEP
jgi:hypothetical protein